MLMLWSRPVYMLILCGNLNDDKVVLEMIGLQVICGTKEMSFKSFSKQLFNFDGHVDIAHI